MEGLIYLSLASIFKVHSMQYKSPVPLLRYAGIHIKAIQVAQLNKAQKALLTELEISETKSLHIEGDELTKDDIISIFDDLKDKQVLQFHQWIYDSPKLLGLIRDEDVGIGKKGIFFDPSWRYHGDFDAFREFVSPYLAQPLAKAIDRAFRERKLKEAELLMAEHYLISDLYFDETFGRISRSLNTLAKEIKACEPGSTLLQRLHFDYIKRAFIDFLNALPEQLSSDRKTLVTSLINLSVKVQRKEPQFCYDLYLVLKKVKCDAETQEIITHNLEIFVSQKNQKDNASPWRFVGMAILLLSVLLRACS